LKVKLINYTKNPDITCAAAAQGCYSDKGAVKIIDGLSPGQARSIIKEVVSRGHHSVIEHASFTFSIEGASRSLTHQLVRHRIASYSQQSQRYVRLDRPDFVLPPGIEADPELKAKFEEHMKASWRTYGELADAGVPVEDARYVLPNACTTNIVATMNARELWHFFSLRTCERAQWEIRKMAEQMLNECRKVSPILFEMAGPPCIRGPCPEGEHGCGKKKKAGDYD